MPKKGYRHSEATIEKIRSAQHVSMLGNKNAINSPGFNGGHHIEASIKKIRHANLGRKQSSEAKELQRLRMLGNTSWINSSGFSDHAHSPDSRERAKASCEKWYNEHTREFLTTVLRGSDSPQWLGGLSNFPYPFAFNEQLKRQIRERDGNVCQLCSKTEEQNGRKLDVHHVGYDKENCESTSLVSLCRRCHSRVNTNRDHWRAYFLSRLEA